MPTAATMHGIFLLDKPSGPSSMQAAAAARKLLAADKIGHGGCLDPMASGLLVVLLGQATRYSRFIIGGDKTYAARITLGARSDTGDALGVLTPGDAPPNDLAVRLPALLQKFTGLIAQTAPKYSALKYRGKPLYHYARRNITVPDKTRAVRIDHITVDAVAAPHIDLRVSCGGGVYIRALASDIGDALGCGAYLSALRRLHCGCFDLADATTMADLQALPLAERQQRVRPVEQTVSHLPRLNFSLADIQNLGQGRSAATPPDGAPRPDEDLWQAWATDGDFAGLVKIVGDACRPVNFLHWTRQQ